MTSSPSRRLNPNRSPSMASISTTTGVLLSTCRLTLVTPMLVMFFSVNGQHFCLVPHSMGHKPNSSQETMCTLSQSMRHTSLHSCTHASLHSCTQASLASWFSFFSGREWRSHLTPSPFSGHFDATWPSIWHL